MHLLRFSLFVVLCLALLATSETAEADAAVFSIHTEKPVYDMDEEITILINYTGDGEKYDVIWGIDDDVGNQIYGQSIQDLNLSFTHSISSTELIGRSSYRVSLHIQNDCTQIICLYFSENFIIGIIQDKTNSSRLVGDENWTSVLDSPDIIGDDAFQTSWENNNNVLVNINVTELFTSPETVIIAGTTITWINNDDSIHRIIEENGEFDSGDLQPGETYSIVALNSPFPIRNYNYGCLYESNYSATLKVVESTFLDKKITTGGIEIWSSESYLTFWAKYNMSSDSDLSIIAEGTSQYGSDFSIPLTISNGFNIVYVNNLTVAGDTLRGTTEGEWILFRVFLDSDRLGYNSLQRGIYENKIKFVFTIKGVEGEAAIGGIKVVNIKDYGFALEPILDYTVNPYGFPVYAGIANRADYVVRNIGTKTNTLSLEPVFYTNNYYGYDWSGLYDCMCAYIKAFYNDGTEFSHYPASEFHSPLGIDGGLFSFTIPAGVNLTISIFLELPEIGEENALELESAYNLDRFIIEFDINPSAPYLSETEATKLARYYVHDSGHQFYLPFAQFIVTEISFDNDLVNEGDKLNITIKFENNGYQKSNILVILCLVGSNGNAYDTALGWSFNDEQSDFRRAICPIGWGIVPIAESKAALEFHGENNWNEVKLSWDVYFGNVSDYSEPINVEFVAIVNPWYYASQYIGGEYNGAEPAAHFPPWDNWILGNVSVMLNNDNDGDLVIDTMDLCPELYGLGKTPGIDLGCPDTDKDGVHDEVDNCVNFTNADQKDDDNDDIGNVCDDYDGTDIDEDGVPGEIDNCIKIANSDQKDKDNDGFGDKCEPPPTMFEIGLIISFFATVILVSIGTFLGVKHLVKGTFSDASKFVKGSFTIGCGIAILFFVVILINAISVDDSNSESNYESNPRDESSGSWNNDCFGGDAEDRWCADVELDMCVYHDTENDYWLYQELHWYGC